MLVTARLPRMSVRDSLTLPCLKKISRFSVINRNKQNFMVGKAAGQFGGQAAAWRGRDGLSAQATLWFNLARCLTANPRLLILIHPDVYLDEAGLGELHKLLGTLKKSRVAVLLVSNLHGELERCCDRILQPSERAAGKEDEAACGTK